MSELHENLSDVVIDRETATSDAIVNLTTGDSFRAEVEPVQDIELNTQLGRDARESILLHVRRSNPNIPRVNQQCQFQFLGETVTVKLVRVKNTPGNILIEYGCVRVIPTDQ